MAGRAGRRLILGANLTRTGTGVRLDDGAAALLSDGVPIAAVAEERLTRRKHSGGLAHSAAYCLAAAGVDLDAVRHVGVSTCCDLAPTVEEAVMLLAEEGLDVPADRVVVCPSHHLSHAASAFLCSPFDEALVVVADNEGTVLPPVLHGEYWRNALERTTVWRGGGRRLELLARESDEPGALGLGAAYGEVTRWLGFPSFHEAGQTMALAAFADGRLAHARLFERRGGRLVCRMAQRDRSDGSAVRAWLRDDLGIDVGPPHSDCREPTRLQCEVAGVAQRELERALLDLVRRAISTTGIRNVCLAGGVALNCVANARLWREHDLTGLFVQSAASDVGQALGNALWVEHCVLGHRRAWTMRSASLGRSYRSHDVARAVGAMRGRFTPSAVADATAQAATMLAEGRIVGWFSGGSELGPRALGHRSVLADPRDPRVKDRLDSEIKRRERFRPYAPAVTAEAAAEWFDIRPSELALSGSPLTFMLCAVPVRPERRALVPAITHVDGTARVQVTREDVNPAFHRLLRAFESRTGVPILLNTSWNSAGAPIVETPADALQAAAVMGLDALVLEDRIVVPATVCSA